jgi:hypothetical protein
MTTRQKVVELLRLPRQQAFGQVLIVCRSAAPDLCWKCRRVTGQIKCLGGDHASRLMIVVILSRNVRG